MNSLERDVDHGSLYDKPGSSEIIVGAGEPDIIGEILAKGSGDDWPFPKFKTSTSEEPKFSGPNAAQAYRESISASTEAWLQSNIKSTDSGSLDIRRYTDGISFHGEPPKRRRGRPPSNSRILDQSGNLPVSLTSEANTVQASTEHVSQTLAFGEQPVKRRRGRPPKVKPLD